MFDPESLNLTILQSLCLKKKNCSKYKWVEQTDIFSYYDWLSVNEFGNSKICTCIYVDK